MLKNYWKYVEKDEDMLCGILLMLFLGWIGTTGMTAWGVILLGERYISLWRFFEVVILFPLPLLIISFCSYLVGRSKDD